MPSVNCECGRSLQVADQYAGKQVLCPQCGRRLRVPGVTAVTEAAVVQAAAGVSRTPDEMATTAAALKPAPPPKAAPPPKPPAPAKPARPTRARPSKSAAPNPPLPPPAPDPLAELETFGPDISASRRQRAHSASQRNAPVVYIVVGLLLAVFFGFAIYISDKDRREKLFPTRTESIVDDAGGGSSRPSTDMASKPYGPGSYVKGAGFNWHFQSRSESVSAGDIELSAFILVRHTANKEGDDRVRLELYLTGPNVDMVVAAPSLTIKTNNDPDGHIVKAQSRDFKSAAAGVDASRTIIYAFSDTMLGRLTKASTIEWRAGDADFTTPKALERVLAKLAR